MKLRGNSYDYIRWYKNGMIIKNIDYTKEQFEFLEQLILLDNPNIKIKEKEEKSKNLIKNIM